MEEVDINNKQRKLEKRKLPQGTSEYQVCNSIGIWSTSLNLLYLLHLQIILKCYYQAAWIVEDTDDEDNDSDDDNQTESGMVIDEQGHSDQGSDGSDIDAVSHFTEKFDGETIGDTEMAVSFPVLIWWALCILSTWLQYWSSVFHW